MEIKRKSVITGVERVREIPVDPEDFAFWKSGYASINEIMPYLNDEDRQFILSGITKEEWGEAFKEGNFAVSL